MLLPGDVVDKKCSRCTSVVASRHRPGRVTGFYFHWSRALAHEQQPPMQNTHFLPWQLQYSDRYHSKQKWYRHLKADTKGCCVQNSITVVIRGWGHEAGEECDPLWSGGGPAGLRGPLRTCRGKTGRRQQGYSARGPQRLLCLPGVHVFQDTGHRTPCPRPGGAACAPSLLGAHQSEPSVHPGTSRPFSQPPGVFLQ